MKNGVLLYLMLLAGQAVAGSMDAVPTCYNNKILAPNLATETELFVVIDQTTPFNGDLRQFVANNIRPFLQQNQAFSVTQFSAFTQGHYTDVLVSGKLDAGLPKKARDDISKPVLAKFDRCIAVQSKLAAQLAGRAMKTAFGGSSSDISKSDVIASLKDISGMVRKSKAESKVVLIASDMLENSSISSFYAKQAVRKIDPDKELKLVADNQLFGDFGGARVYVIGAGLLAEDAKQKKGVYRSPQIMQALSKFWTGYFQKSNANLVEFGQPALLNPIH